MAKNVGKISKDATEDTAQQKAVLIPRPNLQPPIEKVPIHIVGEPYVIAPPEPQPIRCNLDPLPRVEVDTSNQIMLKGDIEVQKMDSVN